MKKKAIIISSIIVCLLIAGGITFLALNKSSKNETTDVTESLEAETSTDAKKKSDISTDKEKTDTSTNKKETNTVEADKKKDEKKADDKKTEEQKTEDKKTTENTESNSERTKKDEEHKHTWVTGYRTEEKVVHHDAVTHTETQTTYTTETQTIHHDGDYWCNYCGTHFSSSAAASAHCDSNSVECYTYGYSGLAGWDETVTVQVPHTETVTIVDQAAWDETVVDKTEYTYCSECGAEK